MIISRLEDILKVIVCIYEGVRGKGRERSNRGALSLNHITQRYVRRVEYRA